MWPHWCVASPGMGLYTGDSAFCRAVGDECTGWITRHGPRAGRRDLLTGECLQGPCVSELPAVDGHELSPIPSRSHETNDLPLGPPITPRSREITAVGIPGHIGMRWVQWFPGVVSSGRTQPRANPSSNCPNGRDSMPEDTARSLGSYVRFGHWFVDGTWRINSPILLVGGGSLARP